MASTKATPVEPFAYVRELLAQLTHNSPPAAARGLDDRCTGNKG
jgi:hypothetical protein